MTRLSARATCVCGQPVQWGSGEARSAVVSPSWRLLAHRPECFRVTVNHGRSYTHRLCILRAENVQVTGESQKEIEIVHPA